MKLKPYLLLLPTAILAACGGGNGGNDDPNLLNIAVVATRAPDYSSGAISLIDTTPPFAASNNRNANASSDLGVRADGDHYFLFAKYGVNTISRYDAATPNTPTYTYSTNDAGEDQSNPYDLIVASPSKGYLIRYGSATIWIVNPSATSEAAFHTGDINLSAYDADGIPEMSAGLLKGGKLYIALQRLQNFAATQDGYVAVIDTATDTEINTGHGSDGLKGIKLPIFNPTKLAAIPGTNKILAIGAGDYGSFPDYIPPYNGGIASIDTANNTASLLVDDGNADAHPYGQFNALTVVESDRAYFVGSSGFADDTLYRFDPGSNAAPVVVNGYAHKQLGALAVDPDGQLWVARTGDDAPGVSVIGFDGTAETINKDLIDTELTPINIDFVSAPSE